MMSLLLTTIAPIATIFTFRMLGLFMLIPVFTMYAPQLSGSNPALIGVALGIYGLSQGLMQIPFGLLSDRFGRKPIITLGLLIFAIGSLLGAITHSMFGMIAARCIQGLGAIGSVLIALLADLTPEHLRTFSMAILGASIAISFGVAFLLSPVIAENMGLSGIFYFTLLCVFCAIILLHTLIPTPLSSTQQSDTPYLTRLRSVLNNGSLQHLNLGIFCQHFIFTATFFFIPLSLKTAISNHHLIAMWHFYLPLLVSSFSLMAILIYLSEKKKQTHVTYTLAIVCTGISQLAFMLDLNWLAFSVFMLIYFTAFNLLEAMLPALISKRADTNNKGAAMGVYSSCQFLGIFAGGSLAGLLYQFFGQAGICIMNLMVTLLWVLNRRI